MDNLLIIDNDNFDYLVRKEHKGYSISVGYRIPRKSKKGFVGSKYHKEEIRIDTNYKDLAYHRYENWISEYKWKLQKKEITAFYVNLFPIIFYYVTCPVCKQDAEILTWMMGMEYGDGTRNCEYHQIVCRYCNKGLPEDIFGNVVGTCYKILFTSEEEQNYKEEIQTNQIKWEDWINDNK